MNQITLGLDPLPKKTRKEVFLDEMNQVVPWAELVALVQPPARGAHQALHQRGALGALVRGSPTPVRGGVVTAIGAMGVNQIGGYDE